MSSERYPKVVLAFFACLFLLPPSLAQAACIGVAAVRGSGGYDIETRGFLSDVTKSSWGRLDRSGVVFSLDTGCARDDAFNGRVSIGFEHDSTRDDETGMPGSVDLFTLGLMGGLNLYASERVKLFVGPEFRWGTTSSSTSGSGGGVDGRFIGFGALAGVNFHLGRTVDLAATGGFRTENYREDSSGFSASGTLSGSADYTYVTLGLMFRFGDDVYSRQE